MDDLMELEVGEWLRIDRIIEEQEDGTILAECTIIVRDGYDAFPVLASIRKGAVIIEEYL